MYAYLHGFKDGVAATFVHDKDEIKDWYNVETSSSCILSPCFLAGERWDYEKDALEHIMSPTCTYDYWNVHYPDYVIRCVVNDVEMRLTPEQVMERLERDD